MFIFAIFFACGNKVADTSDTSTVSEPEHAYHGCPGQAQQQCDDFSHCTSIFAHEKTPNEEEECWILGESEYVGCGSESLMSACGDAITFAQSSEEQVCYVFMSTCIPEGWEECTDIYEQECAE